MAKEVALKKIELKATANCCEGCKRKVKKTLRGIEGVLKTEMDPLKPKITVYGNLNPNILIKKLLKVGKRAELSSYVEVNDEKKAQVSEIEKTKEVTEAGDGSKEKGSKEDKKDSSMLPNDSDPKEMKKDYPILPHQEVNFMLHPNLKPYSNIKAHPQGPQHCCIAQPCAVAAPCYIMPSYQTPPASVQEHYQFDDNPRFQPPIFRPTVRAGDYFSDENTMGCHVM